MQDVISVDFAEEILLKIFPRDAFDTVLSSRLAGSAVAGLIYIDAIERISTPERETNWARPSMILWQSPNLYSRTTDSDRTSWLLAARAGKKSVEALQNTWGIDFRPQYADNTRETLRDETFRLWRNYGAATERSDLAKTSSAPRWALVESFAALFDPDFDNSERDRAIALWRDSALEPGKRMMLYRQQQQDLNSHAVLVNLPKSQGVRKLEPGHASGIIKSVIEEWATARLQTPYVISISEPGTKIFAADRALLTFLGIELDISDLLPDLILADLLDGKSDPHFWFVEVVFSDGEINESRKQRLLDWGLSQGLRPEQCRFLTAFQSRRSSGFRKRVPDLAHGTSVFFQMEPELDMHLI